MLTQPEEGTYQKINLSQIEGKRQGCLTKIKSARSQISISLGYYLMPSSYGVEAMKAEAS